MKPESRGEGSGDQSIAERRGDQIDFNLSLTDKYY
jgi:hypothetical protein